MNINFNRVRLEGFMSFDKAELELDDLGLVSVIGINKYENLSQSNGSGKSSIVEAILWAITGSTSRGATDIANSILGEGALVELDFRVDDTDYKIIRSKNHKELGTSLKIYKNEEDISGSTTTKSKNILVSELPFITNYELLTSIVILSQGLSNRLSTLKPSSRKSRLEELTNTDIVISQLKSKVDELTTKYTSERQVISDKIVSLNGSISTSRIRIDKAKSNIESIPKTDITEDDYNNFISTRDNLKLQLDSDSKTKDALMYEVNSKTNKLNKVTFDISSFVANNNKLIAEYTSVTSDKICPTCNQVISNEKSEELQNTYNSSFTYNKEQILQLTSQKDKLVEELEKDNNTLSELTTKLTSIRTEYDSVILKINEYEKSRTTADIFKSEIKELEKMISDSESEITNLEVDISKFDNKLIILKYLKNSMSRNFRSYLLQGVVDYMNYKLSEYSKYLFTNLDVKLVVNGNNLSIFLGDREFENLSGGEGRRVDILLQLVQRDLANNESGFYCNLLVLDEVLDNLDSLGIESVLNLLEYKSPDINSMLVISHKDDINIANDSKIVVVKGEDQISRIVEQ